MTTATEGYVFKFTRQNEGVGHLLASTTVISRMGILWEFCGTKIYTNRVPTLSKGNRSSSVMNADPMNAEARGD